MNTTGVSGLITPFCKTDGLFFNDKNEPEEFSDIFRKDVFDYRKNTATGNNTFITVDIERNNELRALVNKYNTSSTFKEEVNKSNKKQYIKYLRNYETEGS